MSNADVNEVLADIFQNNLTINEVPRDRSILKPDDTVPLVLAKLECPFTWKFNFPSDAIDSISRIENKLSEIQDDEDLLLWKTFVLKLVLCYEYASQGDTLEAKDKQIECEEILDEVSCGEDEHSTPFMGAGLRHVCLACKCFLEYECQMFDEVNETLDTIVPFEKLNNRDKASILCMKGAFCCEYGYSGIKTSVDIIENGIKIDQECGEWFFLLGRALGRLRRLETRSAIPDRREIRALERAVQLSTNASFMVLLAQSYRETARSLFIEKKKDLTAFKPYCDSLNQKAKDLYRKVIQEGKRSVQILVRCALGLMKLPNPWRDLTEAGECISIALEIAPKNPMAHHVAGTYHSMMNDYSKAMLHLSKAAASGVFGAEIDLMAQKKKQHEDYVPLADFTRLLGIYKEKPRQEAVLCYLGTYHYKILHDFKKALEYWMQVIEMDIMSENLKVHFDTVISRVGAININKIIVTEVLKLLEAGNISETERETYDKIIMKYLEHHPGLVAVVSDINVAKYANGKHNLWKSDPFIRNYPSSASNPYLRNANNMRNNGPSGRGGPYNDTGSSSNRSSYENTISSSRGPQANNSNVSGTSGNVPSRSTRPSENNPFSRSGPHTDIPSRSSGLSESMPRSRNDLYGYMQSNNSYRRPHQNQEHRFESCDNKGAIKKTSSAVVGRPRGRGATSSYKKNRTPRDKHT